MILFQSISHGKPYKMHISLHVHVRRADPEASFERKFYLADISMLLLNELYFPYIKPHICATITGF